MRRLLLAAIAVLALAPAAQADPPRPDVRFATFNASLNRSNRRPARRSPFAPRSGRRLSPAGAECRRGHPAQPARRAAHQRVRLTRRAAARPRSATTSSRCRRTAPRRSTTPTPSSRRPTPASRRAWTSTRRGDRRARTTPSASGSSRGSSGWSSTRSIRSTRTRSGPSSSSAGRTCRVLCCQTIRARRLRPIGTRPSELDIFRLSSKSHWDIPIDARPGQDVHFLVSHPTPPVFDDPPLPAGVDSTERATTTRSGFWADYICRGASRGLHLRRSGPARRSRSPARGS